MNCLQGARRYTNARGQATVESLILLTGLSAIFFASWGAQTPLARQIERAVTQFMQATLAAFAIV